MKTIIKIPLTKRYVVKCKRCKCKYLASYSDFYKGVYCHYHIDCPLCGETRHFDTLRFLRKVKN